MFGGKIGGGKTNQMLSDITTSVIAEKAIEHMQDALESESLPISEDGEIENLRQKRLEELKTTHKELQENISLRGHGEYTELAQDEFLPKVTASKQVICHFYHKDFQRCKIIDHHLQILAKLHPETKFVYINAENAPFFVERLNIKTLPTILFFRDGINFERVLGFEGVSNKDNFPTSALARRLLRSNMINAKNNEEESGSDED